ncbi:MAG: hypothetical protein ACK51F_14220 [Rhodospirillales bacterium]|jgi:hypothetical protein
MRPLLFSAILAFLAACGISDGTVASDPIRRAVGWYPFAGGEDLRADCVAGAPGRYRFVYNGVWEEQVRVYELSFAEASQGATLRTTVIRGAPLILNAYVLDRASSAVAETRLDPARLSALVGALRSAGFQTQPADGTRLQSNDFYWLVSACADGVWHLNAWRRQDPAFARLAFDRLLFEADPTGVPVNPPRPIDPAQPRLDYSVGVGGRGGTMGRSFELAIRGGRLWGILGAS